MTTPIIDPLTLTEGQRESIRIFYWDAKTDLDSENELPQNVGYGRATLLEALFGSEFFNDIKQE